MPGYFCAWRFWSCVEAFRAFIGHDDASAHAQTFIRPPLPPFWSVSPDDGSVLFGDSIGPPRPSVTCNAGRIPFVPLARPLLGGSEWLVVRSPNPDLGYTIP